VRRLVAPVLVAVLFVVGAGCGSSGSGTGVGVTTTSTTSAPAGSSVVTATVGGVIVTLKNIAFNPSAVKIKVGQYVRWVWADSPTLHDVTFTDFHSPLQSDGQYVHQFNSPGTFAFHCSIHATMTGTVEVTSS